MKSESDTSFATPPDITTEHKEKGIARIRIHRSLPLTKHNATTNDAAHVFLLLTFQGNIIESCQHLHKPKTRPLGWYKFPLPPAVVQSLLFPKNTAVHVVTRPTTNP